MKFHAQVDTLHTKIHKKMEYSSLDYSVFRYANYLLSEPAPVRIKHSIVQTVARNFVTKLQTTHGLKCDQAFIVYHATNRLARRSHAVPHNACRDVIF